MAIKRMPPKQRQYTESVQAPPVRKRKQVTEGVDQEKAQKRAPPPEGTLRPRYEEPKRTLRPRANAPKRRQVTEGVDQEKAQKRGENEPKITRKQVTEGVAKDPLVKRNTLIPRTKATAMPHVTPEFRQQVKERLASVSLDAPSTRENFTRIVAERDRQLGTDRTANIMSEWDRLQTEPVIGDPAEQKRRQRVRELQRMYHREEEFLAKNKIPKSRELLQMQAPRVVPIR